MWHLRIRLLFALALLSGVPVGAAAQGGNPPTGVLSGRVDDAEGQAVIGAYLRLGDSELRAVTDVGGNYRFAEVPYGSYELHVTYVGSEEATLAVTVAAPAVVRDLTLQSAANLLDEAIVTTKSEASRQQERALQIESIELRQVVNRVRDIGEVIEQLPGVNVRGSGSFGDRVDISLNGLNGTAVRSYIDGLPLEFVYPQFGINNIPVTTIARIDVYKGVVPIDIGTDALGGGINIVTEQKNYNELRASYGYGSFNTHQAALSVNHRLAEGVSIGGDLTYNYSDNDYGMEAFVWESKQREEVRRFHDAYRLLFGDINLDVRGKKWTDRFRLTASLNDFRKEIQNGGTVNDFAVGSATYSGGGLSLTARYDKRLADRLGLETVSSYSRTNVRFADTTANIYSWSGAAISRNPSRRGELGDNQLTDRDFDNYVNRTNLRWQPTPDDEVLVSNLIAYQTTLGRDETRDIERDPLTQPQHLTKNVLGLQYQRKLLRQRLTLAVAGKLYYYDLTGVEIRSLQPVSTSGQEGGAYLTGRYDISDRFYTRASFERALRIPTFLQFFGNGANILSNVELRPEGSDNFNLGFGGTSAPGKTFTAGLSLNGFLRRQRDIIYLTADQFQRYRNAEEVSTLGVEASAQLQYRERLRLSGNLTRMRQVYEAVDSRNPSTDFLIGTDFPNRPKFFYNLQLDYRLPPLLGPDHELSFYTRYKYVGEFNYINVSQIYDPDNYVPVQQRVDLGLNLLFDRGKWGLALNANNLFDAANFDDFSVPRPGRNFNFRLSYRLGE